MSPQIFESIASRFYLRRWYLLLGPALGMASIFSAFAISPPLMGKVAGIIVGPVIFVPWGLLCACVWFHPEHGNMQPTGKMFGKLPQLLQVGLRWYAAIFLTLFIFVGAVVIPVVSLTQL